MSEDFISEESLQKAVAILQQALNESSDLFYGFQSDIATTFYNIASDRWPQLSRREIHNIGNEAGYVFLKNFIGGV